MERPRPSTLAWGAMTAGIIAYECLCPEGELMTEGFRDAMRKNKLARIALTGAAFITAGHLTELLPERLDPFVGTMRWKKPREL